ncbi:MAG: hypothetical protein LBL90_12105 [Prevotellaceae bacterium]|jgi:hypothetical protein|nr:hypothetical protein [Prevotellaceae bacterium]
MLVFYTSNVDHELLGHTQNLIGILTTVIVLCIIVNANNFMYLILDHISKQIKNGIEEDMENSQSKITTTINSLKTLLLKNIDNWKEQIGGETQSSLNFFDSLEILGEKQTSLFSKMEKKREKLFGFMPKAEEHSSAPMYTFFYCIIILLINEMYYIASNVAFREYLAAFLFAFISLSLLFWIAIWIYYFKRTKIEILLDENAPLKKIYRVKKPTPGKLAVKPIISLFLFTTVISITCYFSSLNIFWFFIIAIVISIPGIGFISLRKFHKTYTNYTKFFFLSHLFYVFIITILFSFILWIILSLKDYYSGGIDLNEMFTSEGKLLLIQVIIIGFTILNGLILPFVLTLIRYYHYKVYFNKESAILSNEFENEIDNLNNGIVRMQ